MTMATPVPPEEVGKIGSGDPSPAGVLLDSASSGVKVSAALLGRLGDPEPPLAPALNLAIQNTWFIDRRKG